MLFLLHYCLILQVCRSFSQFSLCCVGADFVPVSDRAHEERLPGRMQPTAPPSAVPEGRARKEEHCSLRQSNTVSVNTVPLHFVYRSYSLAVLQFYHIKHTKKYNETFQQCTLFLTPCAGLGTERKRSQN